MGLSSERERWETSLDTYADISETLLGDSILSSAFLCYAGYFDASSRNQLSRQFENSLYEISYRSNVSFVDFLSTASQRLSWREYGLPRDDVCMQNAVMLERYRRYPLVIDPSGQGAEYLSAYYEHQNASFVRASLMDNAFVKSLESALRFGNTLLVEDVEEIDAILNPILNREVQRIGGRVLIRLADKLVDVSPTFKLILLTRQESVHFTPDLVSSVTFVAMTNAPFHIHQCGLICF